MITIGSQGVIKIEFALHGCIILNMDERISTAPISQVSCRLLILLTNTKQLAQKTNIAFVARRKVFEEKF